MLLCFMLLCFLMLQMCNDLLLKDNVNNSIKINCKQKKVGGGGSFISYRQESRTRYARERFQDSKDSPLNHDFNQNSTSMQIG